MANETPETPPSKIHQHEHGTGRYFLVCLALKIQGCDGAPARAVLWPLTSRGQPPR